MMLKIQNENLLPKGGGSDQPSLEHSVLEFLHQEGESKCAKINLQAHDQDLEGESTNQQGMDSLWKVDF